MKLKVTRLSKKKDVERVYKGASFFTRHFILKSSDNNLGAIRYALVVSTKVSKSAVVRNKLRRVIRVLVQEKISRIKQGKDFIIIISKNCIDPTGKKVKGEEIKKSLNFSFEKSGLYAY